MFIHPDLVSERILLDMIINPKKLSKEKIVYITCENEFSNIDNIVNSVYPKLLPEVFKKEEGN